MLQATRFNLKDTMLSEISHKKTNTVCLHLCEVPRVIKFTNRRENGGCRGRWQGVNDNGMDSGLGGRRKLWRRTVVTGASPCEGT